jgi:hypothetical protein
MSGPGLATVFDSNTPMADVAAEGAPLAEDAPPAAPVEEIVAPPTKGSIQTVLELTFPDLYQSILLPGTFRPLVMAGKCCTDRTYINRLLYLPCKCAADVAAAQEAARLASEAVAADAEKPPVPDVKLPEVEPQYQSQIDSFQKALGMQDVITLYWV